MKLAQIMKDGAQKLCVLTDKGLVSISENGYADMMDAIARPEGLEAALAASKAEPIDPETACYLPVVSKPRKIICVGVNYKRHIVECGEKLPVQPVIFSKFTTSIAAHAQTITIPDCAKHIDYEAELVLVVGKGGKHIPREEALSHIFGCTCGNDLTAREWQFQSSQWLMGKTPDEFAPVGPWLVTTDSIDVQNLDLCSRKNGELRQHSNTSDMIFPCDEVISHVSQMITLEEGDLIFTGTPHGVILGRPEAEQDWIVPGDVIEVEIEGIGVLKNTFKYEK